eukprot:Plantae.Rhodophyta-Purpureofilum_apyrenoidigerum.ctg11410.p1 GENE.Plantae.Rhodophyta-Purpureofilum_apyrenoidigerum.ctg11410~~Plantae.Rhodophyta-Purpureofilum_apyrenoidigerum.ctg11410.p1  ORF type:complete len:157 (-),score=14.67 Plantae.Rhodophyta-Purpureofilum_apyrenoidigerum.ctg11410:209-643(-)
MAARSNPSWLSSGPLRLERSELPHVAGMVDPPAYMQLFHPGPGRPSSATIVPRDEYEFNLSLDERVPSRRGATREQIKEIEGVFVKGDDVGETCPICMCEFERRQKMKVLPCRHKFHSRCIDKWLKINANCPMCKARIDGRSVS